jgi:hypothetical protein
VTSSGEGNAMDPRRDRRRPHRRPRAPGIDRVDANAALAQLVGQHLRQPSTPNLETE